MWHFISLVNVISLMKKWLLKSACICRTQSELHQERCTTWKSKSMNVQNRLRKQHDMWDVHFSQNSASALNNMANVFIDYLLCDISNYSLSWVQKNAMASWSYNMKHVNILTVTNVYHGQSMVKQQNTHPWFLQRTHLLYTVFTVTPIIIKLL